MAHLHTGTGSAPRQWTRLRLCRDVYHCTPVQLRQVPARVIVEDLAMLSIEARVADVRRRGAHIGGRK